MATKKSYSVLKYSIKIIQLTKLFFIKREKKCTFYMLSKCKVKGYLQELLMILNKAFN